MKQTKTKDMILTVTETKDFFRTNKELIKGNRIVFRWYANRFNNQWNSRKLREVGEKILELENRGSHFSFNGFSKENNDVKCNDIKSLIKSLTTGKIDSFIMTPYTPMTHAEKMSAGHYGSLD